MADVASNLHAVISTDGAGGTVSGVGGAEHHTAGLHDIKTFPDHWDDGSAAHVLNKTAEERLAGEISVVLGEEVIRRLRDLNKK